MHKDKKEKTIAPVRIKEDDGKLKVIGHFNTRTNILELKRNKSQHFFKKYNAWGLDKAIVNHFLGLGVKVQLTDTETGWKFETTPEDIKYADIEDCFKTHRPQYFLPQEKWKVILAKDLTTILSCKQKSCDFNFCSICLRGVIEIGEDGGCLSYEKYK